MSSSTHHSATFTWPPTKSQRVVVTGTFDDWSGNTHALQRDEQTGYFSTQVPIRYGEKVAYKYVVDGQWMTREDEAKEWDAAGNMNNVYTAPHAPKEGERVVSPAPAQTHALPVVVAPTETRRSIDQSFTEKSAPSTTSAVPAQTSAIPVAAPATTEQSTSPTATDNNRTNESTDEKKKHGLAGLAATAASAIGIHKGAHQSSSASQAETSVPSQRTGDVPVARSAVTGQSGDHALPTHGSSSTHASTTTEHKENKASQVVEQVKTKAENLVASGVPGSSTSSRGVEADSGVAHATSGLVGLNLGAPIGGSSAAYTPAHTTTTTTTTGSGSGAATSSGEKPSSSRLHTSDGTAVAPKTDGPKTSIPQPAVSLPTSGETAVAAKTEAPKTTSVPQPAVVVPGAAPTSSFMDAKSVSDETAVAPKDVGPRTSIPQPAVDGALPKAPAQTSATSPTTTANSLLASVPSATQIEETVNDQVEKISHAAQQVGTSAVAAFSSLASGLVIGLGDAVHSVTGVDIVHKDPVSLGSSERLLSDLEEGRGEDGLAGADVRRGKSTDSGRAGGERSYSPAAMAVPFESQLKRSPRLAQTGFPLPPPGPSASSTRPSVRRAPSSSASLYKSEAHELRRRSWNLNNEQSQITLEEAKRAGINTSALPVLEGGPASARSAEALANTLTAPIPIAKDTVDQASGASRDLSTLASDTARNFASSNLGPAVPEKSQVPVSFKSSAPAVSHQSVPVTSVTDIPLPPAKDGLPAARDDADIQAIRSVPQFNATTPRVSGPVHGSMAGSSPSSGTNVRATTNAATASSTTAAKQPDVFSSNKEDKRAVPAGEKNAEYKTDLPAQAETKNNNHKSVPMPVITSIGNNTKDRTAPSHADNANQEVSSDPAVGTHEVKEQAHAGMKNDIEGVPSRSYAKQPVPNAAVTGLPLATTQKPLDELAAAPATPVKPVVVAPASAAGTPASRLATSEAQASPASASATDSGKKRKSGFLNKVKSVFHKDKAPK